MTRTPSATPNLPEPVAPSLATGRVRADGWTVERQRGFLEALADCGSVRAACARVGMSAQSAYALRRRSDARAFRQAWDAARAMAAHVLEEAAWDRAIHGTVRQHFYHGELVGETRVYSDRLLLALIDRNRAAQDMAETEPEVVEQVIADWDGALDRLGTGDWLRSEDELDEEWADQWAELSAQHRRAAAIAAPPEPLWPEADPAAPGEAADGPASGHAPGETALPDGEGAQGRAPPAAPPAAVAAQPSCPADQAAASGLAPTVSTSSTSAPSASPGGCGANPEFTIPR